MQDKEKLARSVSLALVSKPVDDLLLTMLRMDVAGRVLLDFTSKRHNPIRSAQKVITGNQQQTTLEVQSLFNIALYVVSKQSIY